MREPVCYMLASPLRRVLRLLADSAGAVILRRASIRRLLEARPLALPTAFLFAAAFLDLSLPSPLHPHPYSHPEAAGVVAAVLTNLVLGAALGAFWLLTALAAAEPVLALLMRAAEDDPLQLHWAEELRPAARCACLTALAAPQLLRCAAQAATAGVPTAFLALHFLAASLGYVMLVRMLVVVWRFPLFTSAVLASGPLIMASVAATALSNPITAAAAAAVLLALLFPATRDIRGRLATAARVRRLLAGGESSEEALRKAAQAVAAGGSAALAEDVLEKLRAAKPFRDRGVLEVELLTAAGRNMEAVDAGLAVLQEEQERAGRERRGGAGIHLAMAEACLRVDDMENAAAHADEAQELGAGPQALLRFALASFALGEREAGLRACRRILASRGSAGLARYRAPAREARRLLRRFEPVEEEEF